MYATHNQHKGDQKMNTESTRDIIRILIIEDSKDHYVSMIDKINRYLKNNTRHTFEVIDAGLTDMSGGALRRIKDNNPDIILLDMNYGDKADYTEGADGCQVVKRLSADERKKVICTSSEPEAYEKFLRPLGVTHFGGKSGFWFCIIGKCKCNH